MHKLIAFQTAAVDLHSSKARCKQAGSVRSCKQNGMAAGVIEWKLTRLHENGFSMGEVKRSSLETMLARLVNIV